MKFDFFAATIAAAATTVLSTTSAHVFGERERERIHQSILSESRKKRDKTNRQKRSCTNNCTKQQQR